MNQHRLSAVAGALAAIFVIGLGCTALSAPLVGLAGNKYRRTYAPILEQMGVETRTVSGEVLEDAEAVSAYSAFIIVTRGDPGQEEFGLSDRAAGVLADFVHDGGRLLLTLGCAPPEEILKGDFESFGFGPHWFVADPAHPITEGWRQGQGIQHGRYRGKIRNLGDNGRVLLTEPSGSPIVVFAEYGDGSVIYSGGELGHAGHYDSVSQQLQRRVLRYLVFAKVQDRFGPEMSARSTAREYEPVHTPRQLSAPTEMEKTRVCSSDFSRDYTDRLPDGYMLQVDDDGGMWQISAPSGNQVFAPWVTMELGGGPVTPGARYGLCGDLRLTGLSPSQFAAAHFELRFYDADGNELGHDHFSTDNPRPGQWERVCVQDLAPGNAETARVYFTFMLPTGEIDVRTMSLEEIPKTEQIMAAEEPLSTDTPRPRLLPEAAAADFQAWVANEETGVYNASRADIFGAIVQQADEYLQETEMTFGDTTIPWPPAEIPEGGGGTAWNPMTGGISGRLIDLSLAYRGTGEEKYGERAVELLMAISNWAVWYDPVNGRPSLDVGRMSRGAAWAYDLCYDLMTPQQRQKAGEALKRNTLIPLYEALSQGRGNLNSSALWMVGFGSAAVATLGDVEGASLCTRAVEDFVLDQLDRRATSHPIEGQGYDSWAYGNMLMVLSALERNFGVDHFDHPFLPVIPEFAIAFLGNDRKQQAWLEDAGGTTTYVHWHYPLAILGAVNDNPYAGWYLRETGTVDSPRQRASRLLFFDPQTPVQAPETNPPDKVFPRAGWASLRSGWEPGGTFIAFVCSDSGTGHAQRHQNHFLTYRDDVLLTTDPGYASGTRGALREYRRGTVGHNSVLVDGANQMYKLGSIPHFAANSELAYVMGDATAAYSPSLLQRFHRHLLYLKPNLIFVIDDLKAAGEPRTFQWVLHPNSRLHMAESIAIDGETLEVGQEPVDGIVEVQKQGKTMRVRSLYPQGPGFRYLTYPGAEQYNPYLQIDHPAAEETVMVNLLELGATTAENVQTSVDADTVSVSFNAAGDSYAVQLRLVSEGGSGPVIRVTRNGNTIFEADEPGIPSDAVG